MKTANLNDNKPIVVWYTKTKVTYKRFNHPINLDETATIGKQKGYGTQAIICPSLHPKTRITKSIRDLINGIKYGYPLCCTIQYSLDTLRNLPIQSMLRYTDTTDYVPCKLHIRTRKKPIPEGTF